MMEELLTRARQGDLDAWIEHCLAATRGMAWSFSQSSGIDADDLLQEVAIRLFRKSELVLAARKPMAYARMLARNVMIGQYQKVARRRRKVWMMTLEEPIIHLTGKAF